MRVEITVAWLLRYKKYLQMKVKLRKKSALTTSNSSVKPVEALVMKCRYLKVAELQVAEREILR